MFNPNKLSKNNKLPMKNLYYVFYTLITDSSWFDDGPDDKESVMVFDSKGSAYEFINSEKSNKLYNDFAIVECKQLPIHVR